MNPYTGTNFFTFFSVLAKRLLYLETPLVSDEIQLFVLLCSSLMLSLLGCWLTQRNMTMVANALSHTVLFGIVLGYLLFQTLTQTVITPHTLPPFVLLFSSVLTGLLTTYLIEFFHKKADLYEDASIGVVFTTFFALGILLVNVTARNAHLGIESVMGNLDALPISTLYTLLPTCLGTLLSVYLLQRLLFLSTFDALYCQTLGFSTTWINYGLMTLVSFAIITSFQAIGVIMVLALITAPPMMAKRFANSLFTYQLLSCTFALIATCIGTALSRHLYTVYSFPVSTGGLLVVLLSVSTLICYSFKSRCNTNT